MLSHYENKKDNISTYNSVIDAWAIEHSKMVLQGNPRNTVTDKTIHALAKNLEPNTAQRAKSILNDPLSCYENKEGSIIECNGVFNAWATEHSKTILQRYPIHTVTNKTIHMVQRAESIVKDMLSRYDNKVDDAIPDLMMLNIVTDAWAKSGDKRGPANAEIILRKIDKLYRSGNTAIKSSIITFSMVINAWVKSNKKEPISHAGQLLHEIEQ
jgi:hypothetical protein